MALEYSSIFANIFREAWWAASYDARWEFLNVLSVPPEIVGNKGPVTSAKVRDVLFRVAVTVRVKSDSSEV